jgi:DNA-binding transcriptional LysR family regulator
MYALVSHDHPLAVRQFVTTDDLTSERVLVLSQGSSRQLLYQDVMGVRKPRRVVESFNPDTLLMLAQSGQGVAVVTDTVALRDFSGKVVPLLNDGHQVGQTAIGAWPVNRKLSEPARKFLHFLKQWGANRVTDGYLPWQEPNIAV